jgi:hypothetical protein
MLINSEDKELSHAKDRKLINSEDKKLRKAEF